MCDKMVYERKFLILLRVIVQKVSFQMQYAWKSLSTYYLLFQLQEKVKII